MKSGEAAFPERALAYPAPNVRSAVSRVARVTPLLPAPDLSDRVGRAVWIKAECLQVTGSFKVRGAAARLSELSGAERLAGVVTCSSGNHGRAVAHVAREFGIAATICLPSWVDPVKLAGIRNRGAEAVLVDGTYDEAELHAAALARDSGRTFVSAFDDPWVIAGQGTIALEILEQLAEPPAAVLVALSGGGLAGGIAAAFIAAVGGATGTPMPTPESSPPVIVGVSAERAAVMLASLRSGRPVELPEEETLANALAGGIGLDNEFSFAMVRDHVAEHCTVSEDEIAAAMAYSVRSLRLVVEGGGAVGLAALLHGRWQPDPGRPGPIVVVLSGGNVSADVLAEVLRRTPPSA